MQAAYGIKRESVPEGYTRQYWELPNLLYSAFGRLAFALSDEGEEAVSVLQTGLYLISTYLVWNLVYRFATPSWANAVALIYGIYGFHSYAVYFMPEILYSFLFLVLATVWSLGYGKAPQKSALLSGAIAPALYFVKPNGLSLIAATALCAALVPWLLPGGIKKRVVDSLRLLLCVLSASGLSFVLLTLFLSPFKQDTSTLLGLGAYSRHMQILAESSRISWDVAFAYAKLATVHLAFIGPFCLCGAYFAFRWISASRSASSESEQAIKTLALFTIISFFAALSLTIHFTITIGDHELSSQGTTVARIHGRYYSFILPLFLVLLACGFAKSPAQKTDRARLYSALLLPLALGSSLYYLARPQSQLNWFDFPEILGLDTTPGLALAFIALALQGIAIAVPHRRWPKPAVAWAIAVLLAYSSYNSYAETRRWNSETRHHTFAGARFAEVVPEAERPYTVLITSQDSLSYYFNFGFRHSTIIPKAGPARIPHTKDLPPQTRWLVTYNPETPVELNRQSLSLKSEYLNYRLYQVD